MPEIITQHWEDFGFCRRYAETWEISTDERHYGWLAPGEDTLRLLGEFDGSGKTVLDIGCGMGENLIAYANLGAHCFGVDISPHMIAFAREKSRAKLQPSQRPTFVVQDMRELTAFEDVEFDLTLSIYSLEYLKSLDELRDVLFNVFNRAKAGGLFVFCFSHQLQHHGHAALFNESAFSGDYPEATMIYSFRDVIQVASEVGFVIERVVEHKTENPSRIGYEESLKYPYHFHRGKNPCRPEYDGFSNGAPHTVIYKCRKPQEKKRENRQHAFDLTIDRVRLWGEPKSVRERILFGICGSQYEVLSFPRHDSLVAICSVANFTVWAGDLHEPEVTRIHVDVGPDTEMREVLQRSLLGIINHRLILAHLAPRYRRIRLDLDRGSPIYGTLLSAVDPVRGVMRDLFPHQSLGILVFLNGEEPGEGRVSLESVFPKLDDHVEVVYIATGWRTEDARDPGSLFDLD
jgi:ubiquinone/menaquinone biosynthesis C-methylase UbiE